MYTVSLRCTQITVVMSSVEIHPKQIMQLIVS